ncbi:MAG: iron-containing alcohol dehydrogenase [Chloroflexi bacterium]|nr:iron-containing alcohol dehydrogenase [Chloroflexota bacterium]
MRPTDIASSPLTDTVFTLNVPDLKVGLGATREVGYEARRLGIRRALVVVGPRLEGSETLGTVLESLAAEGVESELCTRVRVEPEDEAVLEAYQEVREKRFDGVVSVGGGSTIDTAKMLNLLTSYPAELMDYVNKPVGKGLPPGGRLKPHVAVPTTAGTGSESTGVAILDITALRVKTGISHPYLRPDVAVVDPLNTLSLPPMVTASAGLDVLNHAIESFTARPYTSRPRVARPAERPVYAGATPVGDIFALEAIRWVHRFLRRAVARPHDLEARYYMALAASVAGIGFGHAGVHVPHAMGYPIAGLVRGWHPADYDFGYPLSPHGISTAIPAAYVFRYLARFDPDRFAQVAEALELPAGDAAQVGERLFDYYMDLLSTLGIPLTLGEIGFGRADLERLTEGTMAQQRLIGLAPKEITREEVRRLFEEALSGE